MSILRVANLQFNASGTRRIDYDAVADDGIINISADAIKLPVGDTASRPNSTAGIIRYNSDTGYMEFGGATNWVAVASNVAFDVANAAYASANNVAPQVTPAFNTANAAFGFSNTVNTFAYGVALNTSAAFAAANNIGPQLAPAYNTANAAFGVANTALQNTNVTLAGNLTVTENVVANKQVTVTYTPTTTVNAAITSAAANTQGGIGYADFLRVTNLSGGTNPNKTFRLNSTGGIEIVNSAYTATIFTLDNNGILATSPRGITSSSMPAGSILQVVSTRNGDYYSTTSQSWTDITGLSLTITPTSSTSKIFLMLSFGRVTTNAGNLDYAGSIRILGNGSDSLNINGNASGSREKVAMVVNGWAFNADHCPGGLGCSGLESPATTSAITYKVQVRVQGPTFFMNGTPNNGDSGQTYHSRSQTSFTAWEIAQ